MSFDAPHFTVIVPVYNKADYVGTAIRSILRQSYERFELIIVDDASTDGSSSIVRSFNDPRITLRSRDKPGAGGYAARNLGISEARGKWICFLDADDEWNADRLENTYKMTIARPSCRLFSCNWLVEGSTVPFLNESFFEGRAEKVLNPNSYLLACINGQRPVNTNVITVHRSLLSDSQLFPSGETERTGDVITWLKLILRSGELVTGAFIGAKRNLTTGTRVSQANKPNPRYFAVSLDLATRVDANQVDQALLEKYLSRLYSYTLKEADFLGAFSEGMLRHLSFRRDPWHSCKTVLYASFPTSIATYLKHVKRSWLRRYGPHSGKAAPGVPRDSS